MPTMAKILIGWVSFASILWITWVLLHWWIWDLNSYKASILNTIGIDTYIDKNITNNTYENDSKSINLNEPKHIEEVEWPINNQAKNTEQNIINEEIDTIKTWNPNSNTIEFLWKNINIHRNTENGYEFFIYNGKEYISQEDAKKEIKKERLSELIRKIYK
jgi:hypothetical protein